MSFPLVDLPSRPERVHVKQSEGLAVGATGFQSGLHSSQQKSKKRKPHRAMHDVVRTPSPRDPSNLPKDSIFNYFQDKTEKIDGASCVFLLWGSKNSESSKTWAVDVPITNIENEDEIFESLKKKYDEELGRLGRYLSFRIFSRIKPVTFRLICRDSQRFLVFVEPLDLEKLHKSYSEEQQEAEKAIELIGGFDSNGFPNHCYRNSSGEYNHDNGNCPTNLKERDENEGRPIKIVEEDDDDDGKGPNSSEYNHDDGVCPDCSGFFDHKDGDCPADPLELPDDTTCPFEEWDRCNDQIRWIKTASFLSCYFRNPAGARSQNILNGLDNHRFIHHYRHITFPVHEFRPQARYIELDGLYVETAWCPRKCLFVFLGTLFPVLIGGKLFGVSWEVIFGAGSFVVALLMLILTILSWYDV